jgi:hypothetical protein
VKPPRVMQDLWRDLRDKRLLPVVGVLAVALIAIPVALSGGSDAVPAGGIVAPGSGAEAPEAEPVVLVDVPTIRDYNERLQHFKRKNPFRQQYTGLPKSAQKALESEESDSGGGTTATLDEASGGASASGTSSGGTSDGGSSTGGGSGGSGGHSSTDVILFTWEANVKVGPVGDAKKLKGVKQGEFLPDEEHGVALFVSGNVDKGEALFYVSRDVTSTSGDGRCLPKGGTCEFLVLKEGQERRLEYEPDGQTYRLKLTKVKLKTEHVDPDKLSAKQLRKRRTGYSDLMAKARK